MLSHPDLPLSYRLQAALWNRRSLLFLRPRSRPMFQRLGQRVESKTTTGHATPKEFSWLWGYRLSGLGLGLISVCLDTLWSWSRLLVLTAALAGKHRSIDILVLYDAGFRKNGDQTHRWSHGWVAAGLLVICIVSKSLPCTDVHSRYIVSSTLVGKQTFGSVMLKQSLLLLSDRIDFTLITEYIMRPSNVSIHSMNSLNKQRSILCNYCPLNSSCEYLKS